MRKTVKHSHFLLALSGILLLGGCALPPAVMVASYAIDGVSFIVSGKSITDHAISVALKKDCALIRVVAGRAICVDANDGTSPPVVVAAIPAGDNWTGDAALAPAGEPELELAAMTPRLGADGMGRPSLVTAMLPSEIMRPAPWHSPRLGLLSVGGPESTQLADLIGMDLIGFGAPVAGGPDDTSDPTSKLGPAKLARGAGPAWGPAQRSIDVPSGRAAAVEQLGAEAKALPRAPAEELDEAADGVAPLGDVRLTPRLVLAVPRPLLEPRLSAVTKTTYSPSADKVQIPMRAGEDRLALAGPVRLAAAATMPLDLVYGVPRFNERRDSAEYYGRLPVVSARRRKDAGGGAWPEPGPWP